MSSQLTEKQQHWLGHVNACRRSGQSTRSYAEANGLSLAALYNWTSVLRSKGVLDAPVRGSGKLFRQAAVVDGGGGRCHVVLPTGLMLEFDDRAEPAWVAALVQALSA